MATELKQKGGIIRIPLDAAFPETTQMKRVGERVMTNVVDTRTGEIVSPDYSGRPRFASTQPEPPGNYGNQT